MAALLVLRRSIVLSGKFCERAEWLENSSRFESVEFHYSIENHGDSDTRYHRIACVATCFQVFRDFAACSSEMDVAMSMR
jgi:hypothetical protein